MDKSIDIERRSDGERAAEGKEGGMAGGREEKEEKDIGS